MITNVSFTPAGPPVAERRTAQVRVRPRVTVGEGSGRMGACPFNCGQPKCSCGGTIFYATPTRARQLIDAGAVDLVNFQPVEQPMVGPSETKPIGPSEKKTDRSVAVQVGPSTALAPSSAPGPAASSSASAADPALPPNNAPPLRKRGRPRKLLG